MKIRLSAKSYLLLAFFALLSLLGSIFINPSTSDASGETWTGPDDPVVEMGPEVSSNYPQPGNRDCMVRNLFTLVLESSDPNSIVEKTVTDCVVQNALGTFGKEFINPGTHYSYKFIGSGQIIGVPNQPFFLRLISSGGWDGYRVLKYSSVRGNGTFELENSNRYRGFTYKFTAPSGDPLIRDAASNPIQIKEFGFSANGKWMVAEILHVGLARIDLATNKMTLFSTETFRYGYGQSASFTLAITNDGQSVLKSGSLAGHTKVYDLDGCLNTAGFDTNLRPYSVQGCKEKSLSAFFAHKLGHGNFYLHSVRYDESVQDFLGLLVENKPEGTKLRKVRLSLDGIEPRPVSYIAMGDSFASGEGDNDDSWYEEGTNDGKDINLCHLSKRSYPYLIAQDFAVDDFFSVACSGARQEHVSDVIQYPASRENTPLGKFLPGTEKQIDYLTQNPSFVTISIGGNDMGFGSILLECLFPGTCPYADTQTARNKLAGQIKNEFGNLVDTYQSISNKTSNRSRFFVIGYPEFIEGEGGSCGLNVQLNDAERYFIQQTTRYANDVIEAAAKHAGVHYIDAEKALEGRNLCSHVEDRLMAVNGVTVGDDKTVPWYVHFANQRIFVGNVGIANESFHPNELGHKLIRDSIVNSLGENPADFQVCGEVEILICPDLSFQAPDPDPNYFGSLEYSPGEPLSTRTQFEVFRYGGLRINLSTPSGIDFAPNSLVNVEIHSTPTSLGQFSADENGKLSADITIPDSVTPGFHEIHLFGKNIAGEKVDYFQQVFIAGPEGDINANNTPDSQESCGWVPDSGVDQDKDGVDDACDGNISEPPTQAGGSSQPSSPGTISGVNNNPTRVPQGQQNSTKLQPQASQTQTTATNIQTGSAYGSAQDQNNLTSSLLNQGLNQPSLQVTTAPFSSSSSISSSPTQHFSPPSDGGAPSLALIIIGGAIVVLTVATWNKYIKTPVPTRTTKRR